MKPINFIITASLLLFFVTSSCSQNNKPANEIATTFVASTPCSQNTRPLPGITFDADCEFIKWSLILYIDKATETPTTYTLHYSYGLILQGTTGFIGGGKNGEMEGKWEVIKGAAANPNAIVYRLHNGKTNKTISFIKLSDDLLHLLDDNRRLMIGNAGWSYTLNRTNNK